MAGDCHHTHPGYMHEHVAFDWNCTLKSPKWNLYIRFRDELHMATPMASSMQRIHADDMLAQWGTSSCFHRSGSSTCPGFRTRIRIRLSIQYDRVRP